MADFENLPADLPENWTQGQIISPNGTEVGLSQQHGYNYLMEQVNHTQEAVNTINASLEDVAQETTLEALDDKIGVTTDTGGTSTTGTVMGKLNKVIADGAQQSTLSVVSSRVGATTDTGGSATAGTVMGKLNAIMGTMPTGIVKSVQRGVEHFFTGDQEIAINSVNPDKCAVLLNTDRVGMSGTGVSTGTGCYLVNLTATVLTITSSTNSSSGYNVSWQVIEFY